METKRIVDAMEELAKLICYEPKDLSRLAEAMYVRKMDNGNTSKKEYSNGPLGILGDAVLRLVLAERLCTNKDSTKDITDLLKDIENNDHLHSITMDLGIQRFSYNDEFFFDEAPGHNKLPNPKHDIYIEAIIGAMYLDEGIECCRRWIE